jgi:hypothetical protein
MNQQENTPRSRKKAPDDSLYTAAEAAEKLGMPMSTFQTKVRKGEIEKFTPEGKKEGFYPKAVIDRMASERQQGSSSRSHQDQPVHQIQSDGYAETDWVTLPDEPYAYVLDTELYGVENSVSPSITWTWWEKNPRACMILYNRENRRDIWGLLSIIPMEEEIIFKLLRGEMEEKEIRAEHVLTYEPGHSYSCYVAAASLRPERKKYFGLLLHRVMDYWCEQYPDIQIKKLYAFALDEDEGDGWRLIKKLYFAPRYDISENAWELRLDRKNPSPILQRFQQCLEERQTHQGRNHMSPITVPVQSVDTSSEAPSAIFEHATPDDIPACIEISRAIFGGDGTPLETRLAWLERNPEIFYVLRSTQGVVGYASLIALAQEKILKILREEEQPRDIQPIDIQEFVPGEPLDFYVMAVCVKPGFSRREKRVYASRLLLGLAETVLQSFAQRGLVVRNLFARSRMPDGIRLLEDMGFRDFPLADGIDKRLFVLEVETSDSLFVRRYREAFQNYRGQ